MKIHTERPGHCVACATEIAELTERVTRLETLVEQLDDVLSQIVRETPATPLRIATDLDTDRGI